MKADDLRTLAADHGAIRADVWRVSAALDAAAVEIERLRGECNVLAGILRDCDAVWETIEPESTDESGSLSGLRMAIAYALDPHITDMLAEIY